MRLELPRIEKLSMRINIIVLLSLFAASVHTTDTSFRNGQSLKLTGTTPMNLVIVEPPITSGSSALVLIVQEKTTQIKYAFKYLSTEHATINDKKLVDTMLTEYKKEVEILTLLNRLKQTGTYHSKMYILMQFVEGKSLETMKKEKEITSKEDITAYYLKAKDAMDAMHKLNIYHKDLNPNNILYSKNANGVKVATIIDFGEAVLKTEPLTTEEIAYDLRMLKKNTVDDRALNRFKKSEGVKSDSDGSPSRMSFGSRLFASEESPEIVGKLNFMNTSPVAAQRSSARKALLFRRAYLEMINSV